MLLWVSWLWAACLVLVLVSCEQSLYRLLPARQHVQVRADSLCCASLMICDICDVISDLLQLQLLVPNQVPLHVLIMHP